MPNGTGQGPGTEAPPSQAKGPQPSRTTSPLFYGGSTGVLTVKVMAVVMLIISLLLYQLFIVNPDSPLLTGFLVIELLAIIIGAVGVFMGNIKISRREGIPSLNAILIMVSISLLLIAPILGSWKDPRSLGGMFDDPVFIITISLYALFILSFIEFAHASVRFSSIDQYAKSQNIEDFNVSPVIWNYFIWYGILMVVIFFIVLGVLFLRWIYMPALEETAPQFANSIEMNSVYSVALSIGIIFVPIAAIIAYLFGTGSLFKTTKEIIIKAPETEDEFVGMGPPSPPPK